ncbi:MAG: hypothetical protein HQK65_11420, partial [Desulfamplus sp.]|nr:hypothetical protein [Desulfamplus sp.]
MAKPLSLAERIAQAKKQNENTEDRKKEMSLIKSLSATTSESNRKEMAKDIEPGSGQGQVSSIRSGSGQGRPSIDTGSGQGQVLVRSGSGQG